MFTIETRTTASAAWKATGEAETLPEAITLARASLSQEPLQARVRNDPLSEPWADSIPPLVGTIPVNDVRYHKRIVVEFVA